LANTLGEPPTMMGIEGTDSMRARLGRRFIITDDDMGWEWRSGFHVPWRE
jgi:hypothetical protein